MATAIACTALTKRYASGVLGLDGVALEFAAGSGLVAVPLVAAYVAAVCLVAGRRFRGRDLLLS